ncbi:hypothetical protein B0H17DRAFT_1127039 [Mycena rosella]|uniref:Uncharacterized protein n=1 Tax=Mycena rosella TaxID=1033263 RepID=A0AAD7GS14_MYCRO|nr:hypothetical protein B0H17DRAFT_1127039 [Mycena rosella]
MRLGMRRSSPRELADLCGLLRHDEVMCIGERHPRFVEDGAHELGVIQLECVDDATDQEGFGVEGAALQNSVTCLGEEHGRGCETSCVSGVVENAFSAASWPAGPRNSWRYRSVAQTSLKNERTTWVELEGWTDIEVVVLRLNEASRAWERHAQLIAGLDAEWDPVAALETEMLLIGPVRSRLREDFWHWTYVRQDARSGVVAGEAAAAGQRDAAPPGAAAAAACAGSRTRSQEAGWGIVQPSGVGR